MLHDEFMVEVVALQPWGAEARADDGMDVFIDHAKTGTAGVCVGERVPVVVLDDARRPFRASMLADDIEIGRRLCARRVSRARRPPLASAWRPGPARDAGK